MHLKIRENLKYKRFVIAHVSSIEGNLRRKQIIKMGIRIRIRASTLQRKLLMKLNAFLL